jgi:hypothetical protein
VFIGLFVSDTHSTREYHKEITREVFHEWFQNILHNLDSLPVTVMDRSPYHTVKREDLPTTSWNKEEYLRLAKIKIYPLGKRTAVNLLGLVSKYKSIHSKDVVKGGQRTGLSFALSMAKS